MTSYCRVRFAERKRLCMIYSIMEKILRLDVQILDAKP
jgi:hypothetical protein